VEGQEQSRMIEQRPSKELTAEQEKRAYDLYVDMCTGGLLKLQSTARMIVRLRDEIERLQINAAVDERLDRVERELAQSMVARCEHGVVIDPTGGYVCVKCFRASQPPGDGG
jgi:hypothetical protein